MYKSNHRSLIYSSVLLFLVMFILPGFSAEGYNLVTHTTRQLGGQSTPNSWVMNMTFMVLGATAINEARIHLKKHKLQQLTLILFGVGLILSGLFKHAPIDPLVSFSKREDDLHSLASSIVGFSFTTFTFLSMMISKRVGDKIVAIAVGICAIVLSFLIFRVPGYAGLFQRIMFILAFTWLIYFLNQIDHSQVISPKDKSRPGKLN